MALITAGLVALITGAGLYFSTLVRRPTAAILLNLGLGIALWGVLPMVVSSVTLMLWLLASWGSLGGEPWPVMVYLTTHPLYQTLLAIDAAGGQANAVKRLAELRYDWLRYGIGVGPFTVLVLGVAVVHVLAGVVIATRAIGRLRKKVF
jgi:hypothetical protein